VVCGATEQRDVQVLCRTAPMSHALIRPLAYGLRPRPTVFPTMRFTRRASFSGLFLMSCSQKRMTVHPSSRSPAATRSSRARFFPIFVFQNEAFVLGLTLCSGHPCQKHPSQNTATRDLGKAISGRPITPWCSRYRRPADQRARRRISSGLVSFPFIRDIQWLLCRCVKTSIIRLHLVPGQAESDLVAWPAFMDGARE
jgi:hypothetical protein